MKLVENILVKIITKEYSHGVLTIRTTFVHCDINTAKNGFLKPNLPLGKTLIIINNNQKFYLKNSHNFIMMLYLSHNNFLHN